MNQAWMETVVQRANGVLQTRLRTGPVVTFELNIDVDELRSLVAKAVHNKTKKTKDGPVRIRIIGGVSQ